MSSAGAKERTEQNKRLKQRASKEAGHEVGIEAAKAALVHKQDQDKGKRLPATVSDPREYIVKGITGYLTKDRVLDFSDLPPDDIRFLGDIVVEVSDMKVYKGGTIVLNVQTTDDFLATITDAIRLSRAHPLFCRLFELFPQPESPYHPDNPDNPDNKPTYLPKEQ